MSYVLIRFLTPRNSGRAIRNTPGGAVAIQLMAILAGTLVMLYGGNSLTPAINAARDAGAEGQERFKKLRGVGVPQCPCAGQVLLGLKSRSLDLYSAPRELPMPFRSDRPPDAGPSFRPGAANNPHKRFYSRNERSVLGWFRWIGRLLQRACPLQRGRPS